MTDEDIDDLGFMYDFLFRKIDEFTNWSVAAIVTNIQVVKKMVFFHQ